MATVMINGASVPVTGVDSEKIVKEKKFLEFIRYGNINKRFIVEEVIIKDATFSHEKLLFATLEIKAKSSLTGNSLAGIVFLRGESVAVLIVLKEKGTHEQYGLYIQQPRIPIWDTPNEIVAGMVDNETGNLSGKMAKEVWEETRITINKKDLKPLGHMFPSCGGSDEKISLFYTVIEVTAKVIATLQNKFVVNTSEPEEIKLQICPLDELLSHIENDAKSELAWYRYQRINK